MSGDTYYLSPHEAALALVATAMKKSRMKLITLIISSIIGGALFSTGGMLHLMVQSNNAELYKENPGMVHLMQGLVYPIGLFYVVLMGVDLFNSNILFFSVGLLRKAISVIDLVISLGVSWVFNLVSNLFICFFICKLSKVTSSEMMIAGSIQILEDKISSSFGENLIKGIAGNFYVSIAIYLQIMCKPIHVRLMMMVLPVFTFVSMGFTHSVADMFLCPMGLFNYYYYYYNKDEDGDGNEMVDYSVKIQKYVVNVLISGSIGNIIGGVVFGLLIPFYLHLYVVERDSESLELPKFEMKDEQPELGVDSRVVRMASNGEKDDYSVMRLNTRRSMHGSSNLTRSPTGVFPVYGMGEPLARERTIASAFFKRDE
ncbi:uncharacterized protein ASCRUDRAFT_25044, partial [Ascoidea rubescens DSM 1968]